MSTQNPAQALAPTPKPAEVIKVLIDPAWHSQPFLLPKRQLCFYSPYLRSLIEKVTPSQTICLPDDDPAALEVLVAWMNYETAAPCYQKGAELEKKIKVEDKERIPLAFKVWVLTHRLGGPCLVLRDECMRYLYEAYTLPLPGAKSLMITPTIALYVFNSAKNSNGLRHFIVACLIRDGLQDTNTKPGICTWETVLKQVLGLQTIMEKAWRGSRNERFDKLRKMEVYMCTLGEVIPGWYQRLPAAICR